MWLVASTRVNDKHTKNCRHDIELCITFYVKSDVAWDKKTKRFENRNWIACAAELLKVAESETAIL